MSFSLFRLQFLCRHPKPALRYIYINRKMHYCPYLVKWRVGKTFQGVETASQKRYVEYYEVWYKRQTPQSLRNPLTWPRGTFGLKSTKIQLTQIVITGEVISNYYYNWQCLKNRVWHPLVLSSVYADHGLYPYFAHINRFLWHLRVILSNFQLDKSTQFLLTAVQSMHILHGWIFKDLAIVCHLMKI